jgi:transposase-like protein
MHSKQTLDRFAELFKADVSYADIAKELSIDRRTAQRWRIECGFPRRRRGPKRGRRRAV